MAHSVAVDDGTQYHHISGELSTMYDIDIQMRVTESHNSVCIDKRYQDAFRKFSLSCVKITLT